MRKIKTLLALVLLMGTTACTDVWNSHYDAADSHRPSDKTLWEEIASRPELAAFAQLLRQTGYDQTLDGDQMFTVWAPQGNLSSAGLSNDEIATEIIENHVARFAISANSQLAEPRSVKMLNTKKCDFALSGSSYTFAGLPVVEQNIVAKNGVLHVIAQQVPFFCNVWEYLSKDARCSEVCRYLYSFNEIVLDEDASVPGAIVDGQITYVDSVVINTNEMFYRLGRLNNEDSTYWMVLPTNTAWEKAIRRVSSYYNYSVKNENRDSLCEHFSRMAVVSDLVFSRSMQRAPEDSLTSTAKDVFYRPLETILPEYASFDEGIECSNGRVFPVDTLRYNPWESWHRTLEVEAENTRGREYSLCELYKRNLSVASPYYHKVSDASYIEMVPTSTSSNPAATFSIPDVLSAKYDIRVVFLPQTLGIDKSNWGLPNKVICNISTVDANGKALTVKSDVLSPDPNKVDTLTVFSGFTFDVCNYEEETVTTKLKVQSQVLSKERSQFSRTLLIDQIILEPAKE